MAPAVTSEAPYGQTSPMELLAAAQASCVCGMVALVLEKSGHPAEELQTSAEVELETTCGVTAVRLAIRGVVPGISSEQFAAAANRAAEGCPVSKALSGVPITLAAELTSHQALQSAICQG